MLLPAEEGYWLNSNNVDAAFQRYETFKRWTNEHDLQWEGVGLDLEPHISFVEEFRGLSVNKQRIFRKVMSQIFNRRRLARAHRCYRELVQSIQEDGYKVETYQPPFIVDERVSSSTLLQRATGMVDVPVDHEVLMLYSSFLRPYGPGFIWSYGKEAYAIALGSTGGGVDLGLLETRPLTWDELARDLRLAWVFTNHIYIFSLEGCIRQGFLAQLKDFKWDQPVMDPNVMSNRVDAWRAALQSGLWISGHPLVLGGLAAAIALLVWRLRRRKDPQN
jgi:hypothetical protein